MGLPTNTAESLWLYRWPAPAKLNLMLRIIGRREDGYHLLQTVFQFVELSDWIRFEPEQSGQVLLKKEIPGVAAQSDLTVRAATILKRYTGCSSGVIIDVEKNIPMGGGLGGGSSDAATVLVVLNKLWGLELSQEKLMELGIELGADVPIFIYGHASWGEGVGEKLTKVSLPECWVVIIKPDCHVNTKEIFCSEYLTRNSKSITMCDFIAGIQDNDCMPVVTNRYPIVKDAMSDLIAYTRPKLTGTGACVFGEFLSEYDARIAHELLGKKWTVFLTKSVNNSGLSSLLDAI